MTAGLAGGACQEGGGGAHLSRSTRQALCGRERARGEGPQVKGHHFLLGLGLREAKKINKIPL